MKKSTNTAKPYGSLLGGGLFFLILLSLWTLGFLAFGGAILPNPWTAFSDIVQSWDEFAPAITATLITSGLGILVAFASSALIALLVDRYATLGRVVIPGLIFSQSIPLMLLFPLFILLLGFGEPPKLLFVTLVSFFPLCLAILKGFNSIDPDFHLLGDSLNLRYTQVLLWIKIPGSLPMVFTGLRLTVTYAFMASVLAEWMNGNTGLGRTMKLAYQGYQFSKSFAAIMIISILSLGLYYLIVFLEDRFTPWIEKKPLNNGSI
jgi:ABC-type nitrate/sulfonate/bicarbonate transport system permease component